MKRVLILGGCGFVGRHFAKRLCELDWCVEIVDNMSSGIERREWAFQPEDEHGLCEYIIDEYLRDVRDFNDVDGIWMEGEELDLVIHCAAVVGGRLKIEGDPLAVATDLSIDSEFFNWCVKAKPKKIVYFSSSAVYPTKFQRREFNCKLSESLTNFRGDLVGMPDESYGWSKLTGEYLAKQAVERYGLDVKIYRPFSGYGEDQSLDYPFPSIIRRVVRGDDPITIWGSGDQVRDFIHIDDIVACVLQTMDVLKPGEVLNLGSGVPTSFAKLAWTAGTVICPERGPFKLHLDTSKPEGVFYRVADTSKMNQFYKPKVSLEEGIRRVAAHLRK